MFVRFLSILAVVFVLTACSSTSDTGDASSQVGMGDHESMTAGPLDGTQTTGDVGGAAPGTQADLVVNIGDRVFFGYNESDLTEEGRQTLNKQAQWLQQYPQLTVTIEGHCDERGTREYNLALGDRRATAVKNYLIATGVEARRINTISYGKERPAVPGSTPEAWAQNRRGVTKVD